MNVTRQRAVAVLLGWLAAGLAGAQGATITQVKDSADFGTYQYEFNVDGQTPDQTNLDSVSGFDFTAIGTPTSVGVSGGQLHMTTTVLQSFYYGSSSAGSAWWVLNPTQATGFTLETRLNVVSQADGTYGPTFFSATAASSNADSALRIGANFVKWGATPLTTLDSSANDDGFHVFRVALQGGQTAGSETFNVYRDGVLLSSTMADSLPNNGLNRFVFGDPSTTTSGGSMDYDYVRFTAGGFAPDGAVNRASFDSIESRPDAVQLKFDDYVSNPPPGGGAVGNGVVKAFGGVFDGFLSPSAANTTKTPLPAPAGVVVESSTGMVTFYDDTSSAVTSDISGARSGNTLTFTFVDPEGSGLPAVVSAVGFRLGSVALNNVTATFYDVHGNTIDIGNGDTSLVVPFNNFAAFSSTDGYVSYLAGLEAPLIHRVVFTGIGTDVWYVGSFNQSTLLNDMVFAGLTVVPEPSAFLLLGIGLAGMIGLAGRRRRR